MATSANKQFSCFPEINVKKKKTAVYGEGMCSCTLCTAFKKQLFTWASAEPISKTACVAGKDALCTECSHSWEKTVWPLSVCLSSGISGFLVVVFPSILSSLGLTGGCVRRGLCLLLTQFFTVQIPCQDVLRSVVAAEWQQLADRSYR